MTQDFQHNVPLDQELSYQPVSGGEKRGHNICKRCLLSESDDENWVDPSFLSNSKLLRKANCLPSCKVQKYFLGLMFNTTNCPRMKIAPTSFTAVGMIISHSAESLSDWSLFFQLIRTWWWKFLRKTMWISLLCAAKLLLAVVQCFMGRHHCSFRLGFFILGIKDKNTL